MVDGKVDEKSVINLMLIRSLHLSGSRKIEICTGLGYPPGSLRKRFDLRRPQYGMHCVPTRVSTQRFEFGNERTEKG